MSPHRLMIALCLSAGLTPALAGSGQGAATVRGEMANTMERRDERPYRMPRELLELAGKSATRTLRPREWTVRYHEPAADNKKRARTIKASAIYAFRRKVFVEERGGAWFVGEENRRSLGDIHVTRRYAGLKALVATERDAPPAPSASQTPP